MGRSNAPFLGDLGDANEGDRTYAFDKADPVRHHVPVHRRVAGPTTLRKTSPSGRPVIVASRWTSLEDVARLGEPLHGDVLAGLRPGPGHHTAHEHDGSRPRLTSVRTSGGTTWVSVVPGPSTHWSYLGRSRTSVVGRVARSSSTSSRRTNEALPSTSTGANRTPASRSRTGSVGCPRSARCRASTAGGRAWSGRRRGRRTRPRTFRRCRAPASRSSAGCRPDAGTSHPARG